MAEPLSFLQQLVLALTDLAKILAEANLQQGVQTQQKLDHLTTLANQSLENEGAIMAAIDDLNAALDAQSAAISAEFAEIAAKVDALEAAIGDTSAVQAELDALNAAIATASDRVNASNADIANLSTAGDDVEPPVEP